MDHTPQIIETFKASVFERILVVDDAYDPPEFGPELAGDLLDILNSDDLREHVSEDLLSEEEREAATEALGATEPDDDKPITRVMTALYDVFLDTRAAEVDPGGTFAAIKGAGLDALEPLLELLRRCRDEEKIKTVGTGDTAITVCQDLRPDLIFMDFFLSPRDRTTTGITPNQRAQDRMRSITLLKNMLSKDVDSEPVVVLMSSEDVADRQQNYFSRLEHRVMALRFGFLHKKWICGVGPKLTASGDAADVLIDISGSFEFGRTLEAALNSWKDGVQKAIEQLFDDLRDFDVKDFAYLLRFRLYEEGVSFADYLEWFMGESLRAIVDNKVEWTTGDFSRLNDEELTQAIEGAHPLPSERIARFFHRVRFNSRESRPRERFEFGDLFVSPNRDNVRMVISPDCDLVPRPAPSARHILTIGGEIRGLQDDRAFAGDHINLIFLEGPKAIKWNLKDLQTHEFEAEGVSRLNVYDEPYRFFTSMRPIPAQTIQKAVLADLSRVAVSVPPTVYVGAPISVYLKKNIDRKEKIHRIEGLGEAHAQVIIPRGGKDSHKKVLFSRRFVRELLALLEGTNADELPRKDRQHRLDCIKNADQVRMAMLRDGLRLPGKGIFGLVTSVGQPEKKAWLEIVIDVSDDALIDLHGTDLLK